MKLTIRFSSHSVDGVKSLGGTKAAGGDGILSYTSPLDSVFDRITKKENMDGVTDYRCFYLCNETTSVVVFNPKIKILTTPNSVISIGTLTKGTTAESITNETTQPSGVIFHDKAAIDRTSDGYLDFPGTTELRPGESAPFWIKRQVSSTSGSGVTTEELLFEVKYTS